MNMYFISKVSVELIFDCDGPTRNCSLSTYDQNPTEFPFILYMCGHPHGLTVYCVLYFPVTIIVYHCENKEYNWTVAKGENIPTIHSILIVGEYKSIAAPPIE